jgi:hypothetical protein
MTDTSRDAKVTAWHLKLTRKIAAERARLAAEADERAGRPRSKRRTAASPNRRRDAGPADAAEQGRRDAKARRLAEAREMVLLKLEQTAMEILRMGMD